MSKIANKQMICEVLMEAAKTDKDRKLILDAIAERYKKVDNKQGYYLRLLIDLIKQEVADIKDIETKYYLQELASVHLKTIIKLQN